MSLFDVGVDTLVLFVWIFRGDNILGSFGVPVVFIFAAKNAFAFAYAAALAFAAAVDCKSAASFSSFKRLVFDLALVAATSLDLIFLLGFGILDSRDIFCCRCC